MGTRCLKHEPIGDISDSAVKLVPAVLTCSCRLLEAFHDWPGLWRPGVLFRPQADNHKAFSELMPAGSQDGASLKSLEPSEVMHLCCKQLPSNLVIFAKWAEQSRSKHSKVSSMVGTERQRKPMKTHSVSEGTRRGTETIPLSGIIHMPQSQDLGSYLQQGQISKRCHWRLTTDKEQALRMSGGRISLTERRASPDVLGNSASA